MKTIKLTLILSLGFLYCDAQAVAVKTKMVCFKDPKYNFHQELTETGKRLFDTLFSVVKVDTTNSTILKMEDLLAHTSREYLNKRTYHYVVLYKVGDDIKIKNYVNNVGTHGGKQKILLRYTKSDQNDLDKIALHIIE